MRITERGTEVSTWGSKLYANIYANISSFSFTAFLGDLWGHSIIDPKAEMEKLRVFPIVYYSSMEGTCEDNTVFTVHIFLHHLFSHVEGNIRVKIMETAMAGPFDSLAICEKRHWYLKYLDFEIGIRERVAAPVLPF